MYRYLEAHGLLDKDSETIKEGKARYRKEYLTNHKRNYRTRTTSHTIACKPIEEKTLSLAAREHGMSTPEYVRMAALAYSEKKYLVPQSEALVQLKQELIFLRTQISRISNEKRGLFQRDRSEQIETLLESFAVTLRVTFQEPRDLEATIRETVSIRPSFLNVLKTIITGHGCKRFIKGQLSIRKSVG